MRHQLQQCVCVCSDLNSGVASVCISVGLCVCVGGDVEKRSRAEEKIELHH